MKYRHLLLFSMIFLSPALYAQENFPKDGLVSGSFTVTDERADDEISEISRLYINGHLAATFTLDLSHSTAQETIPIPMGYRNVKYSLCGTVTVTHNNHIETHIVSNDGILHNPDGHSYAAVGSENFTDFFLSDQDNTYNDDEHSKSHSSQCVVSNS